jgi:hypothetical protein
MSQSITITITEALCTLKNINARIQKETSTAQFLACYQIGKAPNGFKTVDEFVAKATATYQSINALIERRNGIKAAIVASNATKMVQIAGREYTVAEAIERKNSIELQKNLLQVIVRQVQGEFQNLERGTNQVQQRLDQLIEQNLGKDAKTNPEDVKAITDAFLARNEVKIADPLNAKTVIETLSNDINDFLTNVDVQLSVSNATTLIEVK